MKVSASRWLGVVVALMLGTVPVYAMQDVPAAGAKASCAVAGAEISRDSRPAGALRADPAANDTARRQISGDIQRACDEFSAPDAVRTVRLKIADNNIIVSGTVPTNEDAQRVVTIVQDNADGRTVFNRLKVATAIPEPK